MKIVEIDLTDTDSLDHNLIEVLNSSIQTSDFSILFDSLKDENSYPEQLNGIYLKINDYVSDFCSDLCSSQILVANALQLLTELIQVFGIREILCLKLSRTILSLIIDEHCSINNIKRAVNVFNSLVKKQSVISSLIQDDALEGSLQIFGRKIPEIGDYECQALLYESLYRITCDKNREYWANIWFLDPVAKKMFLSLDPGKFETNCRAALNYINRNELNRRVFSVIAYCVSFGSFKLKQPSGSEFWIDFNYGSQSISFYCSELSGNDSLNDSDLWETILINNPFVTSYYIKENEAENVKVVTLILNCPCQNLMTCSVISNPEFNSFEIKLSFHGLYDVYTHLEAIYGKEKFRVDPLPKNPKTSDCSNIIKCSDIFENGTAEALSNEIFSKRKISDSFLISVKTEETEDAIPAMEEAQQLSIIFDSSEPLKVPKTEYSENVQYETHPAKKIYNSEPIPLTSMPEIETFQGSIVPQTFSEINSAKRKVSCSSVNIKIKDEYEHQVIEDQERQKAELTIPQRKKTKLTNSSSLNNNICAALMKGIIDKTTSNTELKSSLKSCTNEFMSTQAHMNGIDICTSKYGKKHFLEENVDFYSEGICDKKKVIDSIDKSKTKENGDNGERNSVVSDAFSDVSMVEDSQIKTHGLVKKSGVYLRNRLKRPSSEPLELSTAPKEKVLRRPSSMTNVYYSNGFDESAEDDYEIIPCSKDNKLSCLPYPEKKEGQERQSNVEKKRKKRRTRRRSRRIRDKKISPTSKSSSSSPDNINIKNLKSLENKKNSANEGRQKKVCNMKEQIRKPIYSVSIPTDNNDSDKKVSPASKTSSSSPDNIKNLKPLENKKNSASEGRQKKVCNMEEQIRKPINSESIPTDNNISTSEMHRYDSISLKKNYSDLNLTVNLTDRNSFENIQKEISDESCVILDENVVVVEDSFNEKRYPEKRVQDQESKTSSSPKKTLEGENVHLSPAVRLQNEENKILTCIDKITKYDEKKSSEKPKTHSAPDIASPKSKEEDSKVCSNNKESQLPYKESGESSKGTTNSESASKKQPPKKRLYNLDNAPVFDVPPSKFSNKSPKRGFSDHSVWNLNTDEQDHFEDNINPNCDRKNASNIQKSNNLRVSDDKLKIYDKIAESDEDFEEHNNRDLKETRKRPRSMSQRKRSSKKKRTDVSQTDKNIKSMRTRREAAVKAMKVNKRILDPAPEVACDEIKVMGESDDSPKNTAHKPEKKRKYSKVFGSSRHSSTETGSSEVSWLKKPCPLFESPKRNYSQWKKQLKKKSLPVKNLPVKNLPAKSLPVKNLPVKNLLVKSLPVKVVPASKPTPRKTYHTISTETGSKSKSLNWSDLENFNLTVEKNTEKSYRVLHDLENHMKSLSTTSHNRNDKNLSSNNVPFQISSLHSKHASDKINVLEQYNEPNNDHDTAYDNDQYNDSRERHNYRDNHDISDSHEDKPEMMRKQKSTSNNYIISDEVETLKSLAKSTTLVPQSIETYDSLHKERGSECSQSLPPEDECYSRIDINDNIPLKDFGNETKGKQLHLQRFLECAVRYSESQKSSSLPNMNSSLDHSKDIAESAESRETVNKVIRSKSDELPMSQTRRNNEKHKYPTDTDTLKKKTAEDLGKENSKYFKDCTIDELTLRKSVDLLPQEDKNMKSCEMKRKKTYCGSEEKIFERHQKKSKLNENLTLLKNCTIDSLSLMHSSGHSRDEKSSKNTDDYGFTNKISSKGHDSRNSELNRSESLTKKNTLKSNSILNNSRLTTFSFKETEADNNWFSRITFQLSQDADAMARRLLATVQKCFYDFSTKMCFLRENIIKTTETFEMSSVQNVNVSKLKNLIQTCRVIRTEVEKSLKTMEMTGKEYFETEEKHYRKLRHKYVKACRKYMLSMENVKLNAIHNLEGNVILKAKNFFRKFLKYIDAA